MKKIFIAVLLGAALIFSSCMPAPSVLSYQDGAAKVVCELAVSGAEFGIELYPAEERLVVTSPENDAGAALYCRGGSLFLDPGGGEMELPEKFLEYTAPILGSFSLSADGARSSVSGDDVRTVRQTTEYGEYTVRLAPDGAPSEISFAGARSFTLRDIIIERE